MEKTRKQLVATVAAMLGDQYKVSISIRHFEESSKSSTQRISLKS